jgi:hypothetical protein
LASETFSASEVALLSMDFWICEIFSVVASMSGFSAALRLASAVLRAAIARAALASVRPAQRAACSMLSRWAFCTT